jgi:DNA-binding NarL/FixJ family response regulator
MTKERRARILDLFRRGWNIGTIALACEVSIKQVEDVIREAMRKAKP